MHTTMFVGVLLLVMLAGYLVLLKASAQEGKLKTIGQIISWIVIITASIGTICSTVAIHRYSRKSYSACYKKGKCRISSKQCGQWRKEGKGIISKEKN